MKNFNKLNLMAVGALALVWSLGHSQTLNIQSNQGMQSYQIAQIAKVTPKADSTIYDLVGGGRYATVTLGQKWTFGGSVAISEAKTISANSQFMVQNNILLVKSQVPSLFKLNSINGSLVAQNSQAQLEWNVELKPQQIYVLQVQSQSSNQSYLIQSSTQGK